MLILLKSAQTLFTAKIQQPAVLKPGDYIGFNNEGQVVKASNRFSFGIVADCSKVDCGKVEVDEVAYLPIVTWFEDAALRRINL